MKSLFSLLAVAVVALGLCVPGEAEAAPRRARGVRVCTPRGCDITRGVDIRVGGSSVRSVRGGDILIRF